MKLSSFLSEFQQKQLILDRLKPFDQNTQKAPPILLKCDLKNGYYSFSESYDGNRPESALIWLFKLDLRLACQNLSRFLR